MTACARSHDTRNSRITLQSNCYRKSRTIILRQTATHYKRTRRRSCDNHIRGRNRIQKYHRKRICTNSVIDIHIDTSRISLARRTRVAIKIINSSRRKIKFYRRTCLKTRLQSTSIGQSHIAIPLSACNPYPLSRQYPIERTRCTAWVITHCTPSRTRNSRWTVIKNISNTRGRCGVWVFRKVKIALMIHHKRIA